MSSLKWLEGVMLEDEEPGSLEAPDVADWLSLTLPSRDSPPQAPAFEFPQTPAAEFSQTPAAETPQTPAVEIPQTPVAEFPQTPVVDISSSPSTSPGSIPVGGRKRPRIVGIPRPPVFDLTSSPSPSPPRVPVGGGISQQPPIVELSSSPGTSEGSVPVVGASPSTFAETSSSRSASRGAAPVAGRKKAKRKRPPKEVPFVEVTMVSPPSLDADEFSQMQARTEWTKQAANVLPSRILVAAARRRNSTMQQIYTPCSWQEFIDRTREAQLKREETRVERLFKRIAPEEGPADPIGSSRAAVEEIYRQRLDPEMFRKLSLFDN